MQMHPNQIPVSATLVEALLASQYPSLSGFPITRVPSQGTDNALFRVGCAHVVRLPIIDWALDNEKRMSNWLPWLQVRLPVKISTPIFHGNPGHGYPARWAIYPWIEGVQATTGCNDVDLAMEVAEFLKTLRSLPVESAPPTGRRVHDLDQDVRKCLNQLLPDDRPEELIAVWDQLIQTPAWDGSGAVWMHGDFAPTNVLLKQGKLAAVIDWSELGVGDPADDLRIAWNMFTGEARSVFREIMAPDDATWLRGKARAFAQASFQLPYYRESNPGLAAQATYVFGEVLRER